MAVDPFASWLTGYVDVAAGRLHYYRHGEGPPVVLLHGLCDNALCWGEFARHLALSFDVVTYDTRGHGLSSAAESNYNYPQFTNDLGLLIDQLGLCRPALIGHSMGATTAAMHAAAESAAVSKLVLEEPSWDDLQETAVSELSDEVVAYIAEVTNARRTTIAERTAQIKTSHPSWAIEEIERCATAERQVDLRVFQDVDTWTPPQNERLSTISRIGCPTLVIFGDTELGGNLEAPDLDLVKSTNPALRIVEYQGAGHCVRREKTTEYQELVSKFLSDTSDIAGSP